MDNGVLSKELYSGVSGSILFNMGGNVYATIGKVLYAMENRTLVQKKDFSGEDILAIITGRSESDLFAFNKNGILHYNGTNWKMLYQTNLDLNCYYVFDSDIFFVFQDQKTLQNYIVKGSLKQTN